MLQAQKISCTNHGIFIMNFSIRWLDGDGNWHVTDWNSGNYAINNTRTSPDLASIGVPTDAVAVVPYVHAIAGNHGDGNTTVLYADNGVTANYNVTGVTLNFRVNLSSP